ncbi:WXG100 family type VII secretion target [Lentzea sp. NPDC051213]|uniref:WXG100 family type VII secretion target n=1 Tax=Lentzea sp. NPDC051213 TaxID=3364126 RepID=UPI0037B804A3
MTGFVVHPDELARCAKSVGGLSSTSTKLNDAATTASVPALSWGALGHLVGLYQQYDDLLGDLHGHFGKMTEGFGKIDAALTATAQTYAGHEQTTTDAFGKTLQSGLDSATAPPMVSGGNATGNFGALGKSYGEQFSGGSVGKQAAKSVPFGGSSYSLMKDSAKLADDIKSGDGAAIAKDVVSVLSDMNNFMQEGMKLAGAISDPLNFLISKGLGWLLDVVAPLKQAVDLVTGDPAATSKAAGAFNDIAKQTEDLARTFDDQLKEGLRSWKSDAGDKAAEKLGGFHHGIEGTAATAGNVAAVLQGSSILMQVAEDIIKGILSDLIEWLVVTWIAAQLAAVPTLGASEVAAAAATPVEAGISTAKAGKEVNKVRSVIQKIMDVLKRIREVLRNSKIGNAFREGVADKPATFGKALSKAAQDQVKKAAGLDKSGPEGSKYTDPIKIANKVAGIADGLYKTVSYGSKGDESSKTDQELDI